MRGRPDVVGERLVGPLGRQGLAVGAQLEVAGLIQFLDFRYLVFIVVQRNKLKTLSIMNQ